jgi:hypothetical protein
MTNKNISVRIGGGVTTAQIGSGNETHHAETTNWDSDPFGDAEHLRAAFRNPLYQTSPRFREEVARAIAETAVVRGTAPGEAHSNQLNGRFQVQPQRAHDDTSTQPDYTDEHSRAMIAKFEASQRK